MKVYELNWEFNHLIDMNEDCSVVSFEGLEDFRFQMGGISKCVPTNKIILQGNLNVIPQRTDYPIVDIGVPLMSKKMISLIEKDNRVKLNKVDAIVIDDTFLGELFDETGNLLSSIKKIEEYQFVQVLEYSNVFDYGHSNYKPLRSNPDKVGIINKLVLREPEHGFSSLFRIAEKPSMLLISENTKLLFESNSIKGCEFSEVSITSKN